MNATQQAQTAYGTNAHTIGTPRGTEYEAFALITGRLKTSAAAGPSRFNDLAGALHDNRRLWTILASDVADNDNGLPRDLRARIVYLAEFTRIHSGKVLSGKAAADPLIEINTAIMRGLRAGSAGS